MIMTKEAALVDSSFAVSEEKQRLSMCWTSKAEKTKKTLPHFCPHHFDVSRQKGTWRLQLPARVPNV